MTKEQREGFKPRIVLLMAAALNKPPSLKHTPFGVPVVPDVNRMARTAEERPAPSRGHRDPGKWTRAGKVSSMIAIDSCSSTLSNLLCRMAVVRIKSGQT